MGKSYLFAALPLLITICGGCRLCPSCDLDSYGAYGGRWQRTERDRGLVGSVFIPAGAQVPYLDQPDSADPSNNQDGPTNLERSGDDRDIEELDDEVLESDMFDSLDEEAALPEEAESEDSVLEPQDL